MKSYAEILLLILITLFAAGCSPAATAAAPSATPVRTVNAATTESPAPATSTPEPAAPSKEPTAQPTEAAPKDYEQIGSDLMASESVGAVKLGMTESELIAAIGKPDDESKAGVWGADGMKHSDWTYGSIGLIVNMAETDNPESEYVAYSITANAPCDWATKAGIKVGDTREEVLTAYGYAVKDQSAVGTQDTVIAGLEFGGIIFGLKDGSVASIFIGAAAE